MTFYFAIQNKNFLLYLTILFKFLAESNKLSIYDTNCKENVVGVILGSIFYFAEDIGNYQSHLHASLGSYLSQIAYASFKLQL